MGESRGIGTEGSREWMGPQGCMGWGLETVNAGGVGEGGGY